MTAIDFSAIMGGQGTNPVEAGSQLGGSMPPPIQNTGGFDYGTLLGGVSQAFTPKQDGHTGKLDVGFSGISGAAKGAQVGLMAGGPMGAFAGGALGGAIGLGTAMYDYYEDQQRLRKARQLRERQQRNDARITGEYNRAMFLESQEAYRTQQDYKRRTQEQWQYSRYLDTLQRMQTVKNQMDQSLANLTAQGQNNLSLSARAGL